MTKIKLLLSPGQHLQKITAPRSIIVRVGGRSAFRRIRKLIRSSEASIIIQTFIWKDDETGRDIAALLLEAAKRGVAVHIMKEPTGDMFEFDESFSETKKSIASPWKEFWNHKNISIDLDASGDHSKIMIFDGRVVLLSGMNIGIEYEHEWHDFLLELRGEQYAQSVLLRSADEKNFTGKFQIVMNSVQDYNIRPCATKLLAEARESIIVEHCYFSDEKIIDAMSSATKRGVDVTVLTPKNPDVSLRSNLAALEQLQAKSNRSHLQILQYPKMFHSKVLLVDNEHCLIGSANFNTFSLDGMGEVCVLLTGNSRALRKIDRRLHLDILRSRILARPKLAFVSRMLGKLGM